MSKTATTASQPSAALAIYNSNKTGRDGDPDYRYALRGTDAADTTRDGTRAVIVAVHHVKWGSFNGVRLFVQPCHMKEELGWTAETFILFGSGRERSMSLPVLAQKRRNDKQTALAAAHIADLVPALAAAWLANPDSDDSKAALDAITARIATL